MRNRRCHESSNADAFSFCTSFQRMSSPGWASIVGMPLPRRDSSIRSRAGARADDTILRSASHEPACSVPAKAWAFDGLVKAPVTTFAPAREIRNTSMGSPSWSMDRHGPRARGKPWLCGTDRSAPGGKLHCLDEQFVSEYRLVVGQYGQHVVVAEYFVGFGSTCRHQGALFLRRRPARPSPPYTVKDSAGPEGLPSHQRYHYGGETLLDLGHAQPQQAVVGVAVVAPAVDAPGVVDGDVRGFAGAFDGLDHVGVAADDR